jgi:hypothetical protein
MRRRACEKAILNRTWREREIKSFLMMVWLMRVLLLNRLALGEDDQPVGAGDCRLTAVVYCMLNIGVMMVFYDCNLLSPRSNCICYVKTNEKENKERKKAKEAV